MAGLGILIFFGSQIAISSSIGAILGCELGKKVNYKIHGERSRFAPKDLVVTHRKWSDIK
jgi:hypothetical protein